MGYKAKQKRNLSCSESVHLIRKAILAKQSINCFLITDGLGSALLVSPSKKEGGGGLFSKSYEEMAWPGGSSPRKSSQGENSSGEVTCGSSKKPGG